MKLQRKNLSVTKSPENSVRCPHLQGSRRVLSVRVLQGFPVQASVRPSGPKIIRQRAFLIFAAWVVTLQVFFYCFAPIKPQ